MNNRPHLIPRSARRVLGAAALAAVVLLPMASSAAAGADPVPPGARDGTTAHVAVPPDLVPPANQKLSSVFRARGVQVYECRAGAWAFLEPAASLTGRVLSRHRSSPHAAVHFRGPSWESIVDGSLVEARVVASAPVAGSIPQLLLQATRTRGDGAFGRVTYVQRLATSGGAAPTGGCTEGRSTGVRYRAEYRFFVPAS